MQHDTTVSKAAVSWYKKLKKSCSCLLWNRFAASVSETFRKPEDDKHAWNRNQETDAEEVGITDRGCDETAENTHKHSTDAHEAGADGIMGCLVFFQTEAHEKCHEH